MSNYVLPDIATSDELGGVKEQAFPVENPDTEASSNEWNQLMANVSGSTRVIQRAVVQFEINGINPPVLGDFQCVWGVGTSPVVTRTSEGVYNVLFPVDVSDPLIDSGLTEYSGAVNHALALWWGQATATVATAGEYLICVVEILAGNEVKVSTYDPGTAGLIDPTGSVVTLVAG